MLFVGHWRSVGYACGCECCCSVHCSNIFVYILSLCSVLSYTLCMAWSVLGLCLDWPILTLCLSGVVPQSGMVLLLFLLSFWYWTEHWPWLPGSLPCYSTWALPSLLGCVPSLVVAACISCLGSEPLVCPFLSVVSGSPPPSLFSIGMGFHSLLGLDLLVRASCSFLHGYIGGVCVTVRLGAGC